MYCSQCGKKVMDTMLFCPFCGSPIVIPEQEEKPQSVAPVKHSENTKAEISEEKKTSVVSEANENNSDIEFVPLDMSKVWEEPAPKAEKSADTAQQVSEILSEQLQEEPVRLQGRTPDLSAAKTHGAPNIPSKANVETYIPQRLYDPDDIFLDDDDDEDDDDDFDEYEDEFEFEEPETGNFFVRHIRGFVALIMFAIVLAIIAGWVLSPSGQQTLASTGLAWKPEVYAEIALEAYENKSFAMAGDYYTEAFERDETNYDYANSASVSYYYANDTRNAELMARKAISLNPVRKEAYEILLRLYPESESRPLDIKALLQKGYQMTGNETLNAG